MRTFTYLNLYGYLTDAVVVNRVFPEEVGDGYFAGWRDRQQEHMELVRVGVRARADPDRAVLPEEVVGAGDARPCWATRCSATRRADDVLHSELSQELSADERPRDAAAAAAVRRARRHRAEEDRPRGGGPGRAAEADYHPAAHDGGLRHERRALRRTARSRSPSCGHRMTERDTTRPEDPREGPDPNRYDGLGFDEDFSSRYGGVPPPRPRQAGRPLRRLRPARRPAPGSAARAAGARVGAHPRGAAHAALADRLVPQPPRQPPAGAARGGHPDRLGAA